MRPVRADGLTPAEVSALQAGLDAILGTTRPDTASCVLPHQRASLRPTGEVSLLSRASSESDGALVVQA